MIDENNDAVIDDGMTFNVRIGFQDLELNPPSSDPKANRCGSDCVASTPH